MKPQWQYQKDGSFYRITTPELQEILKERICSHWKDHQYNNKKNFPGPQPVSLERKDFQKLRKEPYVTCAKLDGERFFLYSTEVPADTTKPTENPIRVSFLINRNFHFFIVTLGWPPEVYKNELLLDGELLDNKHFVIHDSIIVNGKNTMKEPWDTRWKTTNEFLTKNHYKHPDITIKLKSFYTMNQIASLFQEIKNKKIPSDGLVFYPINEPIGYRQQQSLLKWKPPGHHTIDFKISIQGQQVKLFSWANGKDIEYKTLPLQRFESIHGLRSGDIIEFKTIGNGKLLYFQPIKKRTDKPVGNSLFTVKKTLLNVKENIQQKDLIELF